MSQLYVGNIDSTTTIHDLAREFEPFGEICNIKIPKTFSNRNYAFVEFNNLNDALTAIHSWNGKLKWHVELSYHSQMLLGNDSDVLTNCCFSCRGFGHFVKDCPSDQAKCLSYNSISSGTGVYLPNNCHDWDAFGDFGYFSSDYESGDEKEIHNKGVEKIQRIGLKNNKVAFTSKRKPVRSPPPPWLELPDDITEKILHKLGLIGILWVAQYVCSTWRKICRDPRMWRVIDMWKLGNAPDMWSAGNLGYLETLFVLAVDLSQGQAEELNMDDVACDLYLEYIAERCGNLRCLRLAFNEEISGKTLSNAVKKFPLLEELHLQCVPVQKRFIEAIGQSCPTLKTFALNRGRGYKDGVLKRSDDALAIAKSMPELHHLQLFGNRLTNEVLDTILSGCPKLESLDLRHCFNLDLSGELGKRCAQQIKMLWRPHDSTHDYEWIAESAHWEEYYHEYYDLASDEDIYSDDYEDDDFSDPDQSDGGSDGSGFDE